MLLIYSINYIFINIKSLSPCIPNLLLDESVIPERDTKK